MQRRDLAAALIGSTAGTAALSQVSVPDAATAHYPRTAAEVAAGVTPTNYSQPHGPMRYGASGNGKSDDHAAFEQMGKVNGYHFIPDALAGGPGYYLISSKIRTAAFLTLVGSTRQNCWIGAAEFPDYLLEIGSNPGGPNPNVGVIERMKLTATGKNSGILHMNQRSHMWRLNELLFQSSPCPAIVNDNCWDANYTNIDILSCGSANQPPQAGAAVIIKNGSNNIYFRGLRIEQCRSGCIYVGSGCAPIFVVTGKIDLGYMSGQKQAAVTVEGTGLTSGLLVINDYSITGVSNQYVFSIRGGLKLNNVFLSGATNMPAILEDGRAWGHVNTKTFPGNPAGLAFGPYIPLIDLGNTNFSRAIPFVNQETRAAVISRIPQFRYLSTLKVVANGTTKGDAIEVTTDANSGRIAGLINGMYNGCYLVHNPTGTVARMNDAGSRRLIMQSYNNGVLVIAGGWPCAVDSDWSIEYQAGHYTPNFAARNIQIDRGMDLFAVLHTGAKITGKPAYAPSAQEGSFAGCTSVGLSGHGLSNGTDLAGYYLVDEVTGEPYLIAFGITNVGVIGVPYDRTDTLSVTHTYSVIAGYDPNMTRSGAHIEWTFAGRKNVHLLSALRAAGFDAANIPVWGFVAVDETADPIYDVQTKTYYADASRSREFTVTRSDGAPFAISAPSNLRAGDRILYMIRNTSNSTLGSVVWDSIYKMASWVNPGPSCSRSIEFLYNGKALVEIGRTPVDVPA